MQNRNEHEADEFTASANNNIPVDAELDRNSPGSDAARRGVEGEHPLGDPGDRPAHDLPGVGGRTSPRGFDDSLASDGDLVGGMGMRPSPAFETVAAPGTETDIEIEPATMDDREMYAQSMKASLEDRGIELERLRTEVAASQGDVRAMLQQQLDRLTALQDEATRRYHELAEAGGHAWQEVSGSMDKAYSDLKSALESAWTRLSGRQP